MANPSDDAEKATLTDYLAAERTLLSWVRTGLALIGFGLVLVLDEPNLVQNGHSGVSSGFALWSGTVLIVVGVIANAYAGWHHLCTVRALERGQKDCTPRLIQAVWIALFLGLAGLAMAIYLICVRISADRKGASMVVNPGSGIINVASSHSVDGTVEKLKEILAAKGVTLFALVDHSGEAEKAGLAMHPTKLLIFGSPKAGTPVMLAAPSIALDCR